MDFKSNPPPLDALLYLGNYLNEYIVEQRQLPTHNIAGSNRMKRIAQALSLHYRVTIVSPGTSARIKFNKKILASKNTSRIGEIEILFSSAITIPFFGLLFSYFFYVFEVLKLLGSRNIKVVLVYNFDPILLVIVFFLKLFFRKIKIVNNIEDISIPRFKDISKDSEDRFFQQIIFSVCMIWIAKMANGYIIPTERFFEFLPKNRFLVVTGCLNINPPQKQRRHNNKINILFSGKIEFEHGIDIFVEAIRKLSKVPEKKQFTINITGGGTKKEYLNNNLAKIKGVDVKYHGFVSNTSYQEILTNTDVCVALQKEKGRHSKFKTPSKVYEYLGFSKIVIATDVGDLAKLEQNGILKICKPQNVTTLLKLLYTIEKDKKNLHSQQQLVGDYAYHNFHFPVVGKRLKFFFDTI